MRVNDLRWRAHEIGLDVDGSREMLIAALKEQEMLIAALEIYSAQVFFVR